MQHIKLRMEQNKRVFASLWENNSLHSAAGVQSVLTYKSLNSRGESNHNNLRRMQKNMRISHVVQRDKGRRM